MKAKYMTMKAMVCRMCGVLCVFTALVLVMGATRPASATGWRAVDAQNAWASYVNHFVKLQGDGFSKAFVTTQGGTTLEGFWTQAEEIEVAEDAYYENPTTANHDLVEALCDGFVNYVHPATNDSWTSDTWNDDIDVAIIAFIRAYDITGVARWKNAAENNFNAVWNRAQAGDGGICERTASGVNCYENSSANWTFIIAGNLITHLTGDNTYKNDADGVYTWALANLRNSSTGQIYDGSAGEHADFSYNYGYAIGAMNEEGATAATVTPVATYLFNSMANASFPYEGTNGGYNVLPDYGQGNQNDSGFNGIAMRWLGVANSHGLIGSTNLAAAQASINAAWADRNGTTTLVWNDWGSGETTPSTGTYSWDCSAAMAGLVDLPPTA